MSPSSHRSPRWPLDRVKTLAARPDGLFALRYDIADVYGVRLDDRGWYLKHAIRESPARLSVISLHHLEWPLETNGGIVLP